MDRVLQGHDKFALPYLDDVAILSESWADHVEHLRIVLSRLKEAGLTVKPEKCQLGRVDVNYLGHTAGRGCHRSSEVNVMAVSEYLVLSTKTGIR